MNLKTEIEVDAGQNEAGQAFQPAGSPDFRVRCFLGTGDWKVARTGGQECPPYISDAPPVRRPVLWLRLLLLCTLVSWSCARLTAQTLSSPSKHFPQPDRIRYDGHAFTIDGRDIFIRSAAFHYFRTPRALWRDRFQKIKDAGFNTVDTYVPWNWHEREMPAGLDDFSKVDLSEVEAWLKMAQDEFGFYTIVRPGPFICAEWAGGGYPRWLAKFNPWTGKEFWLRSAEDAHIAWSVHWYEAVCKLFAREQITRKPKGGRGILLVQIENEYDHHKCPDKPKLLEALFNSVKNAGVDVPMFTCLTRECRGGEGPTLSQVFDSDNYYVGLTEAPGCAQRMMTLRAKQPDAPGFVTELQGGWFSLVNERLSEEHFSDARHYNAISFMSLLGGAGGLNSYVFVGGTHFGGWQARGQTTTYDYNAAIREWGARGAKYEAAMGVNQFIRENEAQLLRAEGGPCELQGGPTNLFGGVRVGPDGTRFVFLTSTDPKYPVSGQVTVVPGSIARPGGPIYNTDQEGNRVLIKTGEANAQPTNLPPFEVDYTLGALGAKVLVIPPGKGPADGVWYPKPQNPIARPATLPAPVRITAALKRNEPLEGPWQPLLDGKSLPELGVSDQRYALYRALFKLQTSEVANLTKLVVNSFSRDLVSAQVNGQVAKRLYPDDAYAAAATRNKTKSFDRIQPDEFDNRFEISGLLRDGDNEIVLLYENIGFEHGYIPMEELSGIRQAGLSDSEKAITKPLDWQVATNLGGVTAGWTQPGYDARDWSKVTLDTRTQIARKGNGIQPEDAQDALLTWYRLEFELPSAPARQWIPWRLLINASGNGFMWLNGHDIGRHWEAGPQREFFLPECWLKLGGEKNVIVLGLRQTINGATIRAAEVSPYPDAAEQTTARVEKAAGQQPGQNAEWQWSVPVPPPTGREKETPRAFLWIPPGCQQVRGVVFGHHNMQEISVFESHLFRRTLAELGFAVVWVAPAFDRNFRFDQGAGERFDAMMTALAEVSGYSELTRAPLVPSGHSAAASLPWYVSYWKPERVLCGLSFSGQWPYVPDPGQAPPFGAHDMDSVPGLVTLGEYEWANDRMSAGLDIKNARPLLPLSALGCPADGHFVALDDKIEMMALYLKKAAQYRLPKQSPKDGQVELNPIDVTRSGWLVERYVAGKDPSAPPAPVGEYTGSVSNAFWYFDGELAKAVEAFQRKQRGKPALVGFVQGGIILPETPNAHHQITLKYLPEADGVTFKLAPTFLDIVPPGRPEKWAEQKAGTPIEPPQTAVPITIQSICGPVEKVSGDTWRVAFNRASFLNDVRGHEIWLAAVWPGDGTFKRAVQQSMMRLPGRLNEGRAQTIDFAPIADQPVGAGSIRLNATSDAGLKVGFFVREGPAEIEGESLRFTQAPPRARYPIKVTVVAWQYGVPGTVQSAEPVTREFNLTN